MLAVIGSYGPCPALPAPCPADLAPRTNPNGIVNVSDLLAVINAWGPCPPPGVVYVSNGTGGGDWFNPNTWNPPGVPGMNQHFDVARILPGDTVTQGQNYPFTLGYYRLENGGTHVFSGSAQIAALYVHAKIDGRWLRTNEFEPLIVVRNASRAFRPRHAQITRTYDCETFCALLANPFYPFSTLPACAQIPCEE